MYYVITATISSTPPQSALSDDASVLRSVLPSTCTVSMLALALLGLKLNATTYDKACEVSFSLDYYVDCWTLGDLLWN